MTSQRRFKVTEMRPKSQIFNFLTISKHKTSENKTETALTFGISIIFFKKNRGKQQITKCF